MKTIGEFESLTFEDLLKRSSEISDLRVEGQKLSAALLTAKTFKKMELVAVRVERDAPFLGDLTCDQVKVENSDLCHLVLRRARFDQARIENSYLMETQFSLSHFKTSSFSDSD